MKNLSCLKNADVIKNKQVASNGILELTESEGKKGLLYRKDFHF